MRKLEFFFDLSLDDLFHQNFRFVREQIIVNLLLFHRLFDFIFSSYRAFFHHPVSSSPVEFLQGLVD